MAYVVTEACVRCKYTDCVEVCPVDCFHEGENMLVIHPDECIDCGICQPECPADAIRAEGEPGHADWLAHNATFAAAWPNLTRRLPPLPDADAWKGVSGKHAAFSPAPAAR